MKVMFAAASTRGSTIALSALLLLAVPYACGTPESPSRPAFASSDAGGSPGAARETGAGPEPEAGPAPPQIDASMNVSTNVSMDASMAASTDASMASPPGPPTMFEVAKTFDGSYAGMIKFRDVQSVGSLGTMHSLATIYATMDIKDDPTNQVVTVSTTPCHVEISGMGTVALAGASFDIPDVVMTTTHLDDATFSASNSSNGVSWVMSEIHGPIGWKWSSPSDTLPTSAKDSRVFDQDSDGHPGVTMTVSGGGASAAVYFVQVQRDVLSGTVATNGDLVGTTVDTSDLAVIGSDNAAVAASSVSWVTDTNTADNSSRLVHLTTPLTCQELVAQTSTLFQ